ncbi:MAG: hypothetical protein RR942_13645, partial [Romboutsia sp.]
LDSQNVVSKSSNDLLKDLKDEYEIDKTNNNIICVINKIDTIKNKSINLRKIRNKVNDLYSNYFNDIVLLSSKEAINGYANNDENLRKSSNIEKLIKSIDKNFKQSAQEIQIKAKYKNLKIMNENITKQINCYKRDLYLDMYKFDESKKLVEDETLKIKKYLFNHIDRYISVENFINEAINDDLKELEAIITKEIENLYRRLVNTAIFSKEIYDSSLRIDFNISKTKDVIYIQNLIIEPKLESNKYIFNLDILNTRSDRKQEYDKIRGNIEKLKSKVKCELTKYLADIEDNITNRRNKSFRRKYTDYELIKDHVLFINNVNNIIKNGGD